MLKWLVSNALLRPSRVPISCAKEEVLIHGRHGRIQLWRQYSGEASGRVDTVLYVLRFLGSRGRAELATLDPADRVPVERSEVWTVNPPGFGATSGPNSLEHYADAATRALEHLHSVSEGRPIWVTGKSIGTAAALSAVARRGANALVLRNVVPLKELFEIHYAKRTLGISVLAGRRALPGQIDALKNAPLCECPALFVVSRQDAVSPPAFQRRVIDAYGGPVTVVEVAGGHDKRLLSPIDESHYGEALAKLCAASARAMNS